MAGTTLFEKIWQAHVVDEKPGEPALIYIDLHLVHEVTSPQAFEGLRLAGRAVRRPDLTIAQPGRRGGHDRRLDVRLGAAQLRVRDRDAGDAERGRQDEQQHQAAAPGGGALAVAVVRRAGGGGAHGCGRGDAALRNTSAPRQPLRRRPPVTEP